MQRPPAPGRTVVTVVASFEIEFLQFLDQLGRVSHPLPGFARDPRALVPLYRAMVLARTFDTKAVALQRTGQIGTYASSLGQEAVSVGTVGALRPEDVFLPSYRESGGLLLRGVTMEEMLLYWGGDERGSDFRGPRQDFPICVPVGSQAPHAAGVAYAFNLRRQARVAVCMLGDGATSKGDFYEAINFAGVRALPAVFVVCNNEWAISVPRALQSAAKTLAQKAIAAGIQGVQVDGNDVVAVRFAVERALDQARAGGGPSLIEALTYRLGDHTTADDSSRYRDTEDVKQRWAQEPIGRLRNHLVEQRAWGKGEEEALHAECAERVQKAVDAYLAVPQPTPETMFDYLFAQLPGSLQPQRAAAAQERGHG